MKKVDQVVESHRPQASSINPVPRGGMGWMITVHVLGWIAILGTASLAVASLLAPPSADLETIIPIVHRAKQQPLVQAAQAVQGVQHIPMPAEVRGFYMTSYSAASKSLRADLLEYAERNRLNAVVIDVKDGGGLLSFMPDSPTLQAHAPTKSTIPDLDAVLKDVGDHHLYRIARVFVFQDPDYVKRVPAEAVQRAGGGVWADRKGVTWVDAGSKAAWRYNADIAKEVYDRGFDEIQFDYIRFPSDGNLADITYARDEEKIPKHEVIRKFFDFMHDELEVKRDIPISYDLFGYTTWYTDFDLGIGQLMRDALPDSTAVSAMVYPSHYSAGALGFANPAAHPYEIIDYSLKSVNKLYRQREKECSGIEDGTISATSTPIMPCDGPLAGQRPWIQAFDIGAVYDAPMIQAQIEAVRDNDGAGFLLWNARNVYRDFDSSATSGKKTSASAS
jgi:hypothetical protein